MKKFTKQIPEIACLFTSPRLAPIYFQEMGSRFSREKQINHEH